MPDYCWLKKADVTKHTGQKAWDEIRRSVVEKVGFYRRLEEAPGDCEGQLRQFGLILMGMLLTGNFAFVEGGNRLECADGKIDGILVLAGRASISDGDSDRL